MIDLTLLDHVFLFLLIGFSGLIDSMAGGGGLISVPTYLSLGVPPQLVLGTNKSVSTIGTAFAVFQYIRSGLVKWKVTLWVSIFAIAASFTGAQFSHLLTSKDMVNILVVVVPTLLLLEWFRKKFLKGDKPSLTALTLQTLTRGGLLGLICGAYDGLFGPGTGSILLIGFLWLLQFGEKEAAANGRVINLATNVSAFVYFIYAGSIAWEVTATAVAGSLIGNTIGSRLVIHQSQTLVRIALYVVLTALMIKCYIDFF